MTSGMEQMARFFGPAAGMAPPPATAEQPMPSVSDDALSAACKATARSVSSAKVHELVAKFANGGKTGAIPQEKRAEFLTALNKIEADWKAVASQAKEDAQRARRASYEAKYGPYEEDEFYPLVSAASENAVNGKVVSDVEFDACLTIASRFGFTEEIIKEFCQAIQPGVVIPQQLNDWERACLVDYFGAGFAEDAKPPKVAAAGYNNGVIPRPRYDDDDAPELTVEELRRSILSVPDFDGPKPDYLDQRRPKDYQIMPYSPDGVPVEWIGATQSHKTGAAINEALAEWRRGGRVLYVYVDAGRAGFETKRLPAALAQHGLSWEEVFNTWPRRFNLWKGEVNLLDKDFVGRFIGAIRRLSPTLIFIDVVTLAIGEEDINQGVVVTRLTKALLRIAKEFGATVVAITHAAEGTKRATGSRYQLNLNGGAVYISYNERTQLVRLEVQKDKDGKPGTTVFMRNIPRASDGTPVIVDAAPDEWPGAKRQQSEAIEPPAPPSSEPQPAANDLVATVEAAVAALGGTAAVPAVLEKVTGSKTSKEAQRLSKAIRRAIKGGCLAHLAQRDAAGNLVEPYVLRVEF